MWRIGPYRILAGPFRGGFGEVYHVSETHSGDEFALKTLPEFLPPGSPSRNRFRAEIAVWIGIPTHPNVVRAVRAFEHAGLPYVLSEWLGAGDLAANRSRLIPRGQYERTMHGAYRHVEVMRQLCAGVAHIHARGYVHGDLKPGNVMMWAGLSPQITDFGLARVAGAAAAGAGTRRYMAPELHEGGATSAIDIFSAGVIFQELLSDVREHAAGWAAAAPIARAMVEQDPRNRPESFAVIEKELAAIVERSPLHPGIPLRDGQRLSWDEQHADVLPARTHYTHALTAYSAGQIPEALAQLERALALEPEHEDALLLLAAIDSARSDGLQRVKPEIVTSPVALSNLAHFWLRAKRPDEAEKVVDRLAEVQSAPAEVAYLRGRTAGLKGYVSDEIELYREALAEGGDDDARYHLARALKDAGMPDDALRELNAVGLDRLDAVGLDALTLTARIYVDTKRFREAKALLRHALRRDNNPEHAVYLYCEQGFVLRAEGLWEAASRSYEIALTLAPDSRVALDGLEMARDGVW